MEFESKISTSREQSQRLINLGLRPETADMVYHYKKSRMTALEWELQPYPPTLRGKYWTPEKIARLSSPFHKHADGTPMTGEEIFDELWGKDIPSWSLDRLLDILPEKIMYIKDSKIHKWRLSVFPDLPEGTIQLRSRSGGVYVMVACEKSLIECCIKAIEYFIHQHQLCKEFVNLKM